ncbi:MAG TPA: isoleucine--tRNA ligase [Sphingomicrobium sp.]|nr:isoleucine--tRNA ligase [Sphingomicrobium sp.]
MSDAPKPDFRHTVFLPKTDFPMKAGLPQKEPAILAKWQAGDLYGQVRKARAGREKFILHDGPPYANGDIHIGHTLNKVLKDMVVRTQTLLGKDAPYVPGWDCHGLPIEWKIEEQYRKKKLNKDEVPLKEFRAECRAYAAHWVDVQREQFQRLGITGDWDNPYLTMDFEAEATIVAELMKFAESGQLYRGAKPVMWSPVEKTALAEAEIEYEDITSTQIDVAFELVESPIPELVGAHAVVWTTTPWTIPVNQAIAYGTDVEYVIAGFGIGTVGWGEQVPPTEIEHLRKVLTLRVVVEKQLIHEFAKRLSAELDRNKPDWVTGSLMVVPHTIREFKGSDLAGTIARHPMHHLGGFFAKPRPFLPGEFVTTDQGTGMVHMAPDHGVDDFELCKSVGIEPVFAVEGDGKYRSDWAWLGGQGSVINNKFNAPDGPICSDLRESGALLAASADFQHSYPHSWRSKAKVIYRCTPQWFIAMDKPLSLRGGEEPRSGEGVGESNGSQTLAPTPSPSPEGEGKQTLRDTALQAIADTRFVPEKGRNRLHSMVAERPDWVISRQRAWGVPIALFVGRKTGELLVDPEVNMRIVETVRAGGVDAWNDDNAAAMLGPDRDPADYERQTDILDVWFDSGCTHVFTLESGRWPDQRWPADLYLEGSDQHRGWFQSSLLESCGTRGRAPYDAVLTHGFTMDSKGMKMSKSLGNTVNPLDLMKEHGADILRLWALTVDSSEDHRIGKEILGGVADQYRKLRNTFRYLLGALEGFSEDERVGDAAEMPELERYMLHLTAELDGKLKAAVEAFDFTAYTRLLADFANNDLSAFYFDIRKDCLYCEVNPATGKQTGKRRAYRTVLDTLFHALVRWTAPVLVFTTEEVWATRFSDAGSVHLLEWLEIEQPTTPVVGWQTIRDFRDAVLANIEPMRREKQIGSSLQVSVQAEVFDSDDFEYLTEREVNLAEICIVSSVEIRQATPSISLDDWIVGDGSRSLSGVGIRPRFAIVGRISPAGKCGRCWRYLPEVAEDGGLCARCEEVLDG